MQGFPNSVKECGGTGNCAEGVDYFTRWWEPQEEFF